MFDGCLFNFSFTTVRSLSLFKCDMPFYLTLPVSMDAREELIRGERCEPTDQLQDQNETGSEVSNSRYRWLESEDRCLNHSVSTCSITNSKTRQNKDITKFNIVFCKRDFADMLLMIRKALVFLGKNLSTFDVWWCCKDNTNFNLQRLDGFN